MKRLGLLVALALTLASTGAAAPPAHWTRSWAAAPQAPLPPAARREPMPQLGNATVRQVARISAGGSRVRLRISNEMSAEALELGTVQVALAGPDGAIVPGSSRIVTFDGERTGIVPPYAPLVSDAIALPVPPLARLSVSIHLPRGSAAPTIHALGRQTAWIAPGDQTGATRLTDTVTSTHRYFLTGIDVLGERPRNVVVAIGDSITDGAGASIDRDRRWPDLLAERFQKAGMRGAGVANAGISANRVLKEGIGQNFLARLDRDVLAVPGVTHLIVLGGINDIGMAHRDGDPASPSADDVIDGYRQLIARAHDRGVRVIGATILPYKGAAYYSPGGDAVREAVNQWIRTGGAFDGVIDFDRIMRDPADPKQMKPGSHIGDYLHPNDEGYRAMAEAIDLRLFRSR